MKGVAIIPARGGSKRLPRKNILDFCGIPMINWTINAARKTNLFDKVIVSTEDDEIAEISKNAGADVDKRDDFLATDEVTVDMVCEDLLDKYERLGNDYQFFCCLYATAPLRNANDIVNTANLVMSESCQQAMAVTNFNLPAFQAMFFTPEGELSPLMPGLIYKRSSDLSEIVVDNGSTYVSTVSAFRNTKKLLAPNMMGYKMHSMRSIDINDESDYKLALHYADILKVKNTV